MTTKTVPRPGLTALVIVTLAAATTSQVQAQTVLFSDNFNRANNLNISASSTGMSGTAAPMTYKESDLLPTPNNDALSQVLNNSLYLAFGPNASTVGLQSHNFIDSQILTDGGFRVSMDMQKLSSTQTATDNYCGFGVGISASEMANLSLDFNGTTGPRGNFGAAGTGVADFYTCWTMNAGGDVQIFFQGVATGTQFDVNVGTVAGVAHTLRADFYPAGFGAGDNVNVSVYIDNTLVVNTSFTWHDANANYIATSARIDAGFIVDNLLVQTIPPPAIDPTLHWLGDGAANEWNTSSLNWSNLVLGVVTNFSAGKGVTFDDGSVNPNVSITGTVSPASMLVNNNANNYAFSGGGITGTNSLTKSGTGSLTLNQSNSFSGGTTISAGRLRVGNDNALGNGLATIGSSTISSDGGTARALANAVTIAGAAALGHATDNGRLTFVKPIDLGGAGRTVTINSDVIFANGATNGTLTSKLGKGTLTLNGVVNFSGAADVQDGTTIFDAASVTNTDRLIADTFTVNGIARLVITNGAIVTVTTTVGNLRSGRQASTGTNYVDLAGPYYLPNADSANGNLTLQANAAYSEITFWPGGDFTARGVFPNGSGSGLMVFKFNGGILRARSDNATFFQGLSQTLVQARGANIDDGGFSIAIAQNLLDGGGGGGLNKIGGGTLLLNGGNTFTGSTVVSNGTFGGGGSLTGPLTIQAGATLNPGAAPGAVGVLTVSNNLTLAAGSFVAMEMDKASLTNDSVRGLNDVAYAGLLIVTNVSNTPFAAGDTFTLFNASGNKSGNFTGIILRPSANLLPEFDPATGTLTLTAPPAGADFFTVSGNSANNPLPVLANDAGNGLTLVGVTTPANGAVSVSGTNVLYTPNVGFIGTDGFSYTNQDNLGASNIIAVNITVTAPPNYVDHYQVLRNSSSNALDILRNDGAGMAILSILQPTNGAAAISGTNVIYTPNSNYFGTDSFTYTSQTPSGVTFTTTVSLDVRQYPNFVFILADDQGWTGLSVQMDKNRPDSKSDYYRTPQMETLAAQGMRFSLGYAPHPNCSPSRYANLTGQNCARLQMTDIIGRNNTPVSGQFKLIAPGKAVDAIQSSKTTTPELLKSIPGAGYSAAHFGKWHLAGGGPVSHGFDADANDGATGNAEGDTGTEPINPDPKRTYSITDRALAYLDSRVTNGTPFYLQASHYAVHEVTQTSQSSYDSYAGVPLGTWHNNRNYAGMTTDLDVNVGRLLDKLDELGIRNSTYVIYQGDNGAPQSQSENYPLRGYKPEVWEGGTRTPTFVRGPSVPANSQCNLPVMGIDILPTIWQWATGSTTNLPAGVDGGSLVATITSIAQGSNAPAPVVRGGELVHHSPHYFGPTAWPNDWQLNAKDMRPRSTIHDGHYKLVANYEPGTIELYDLNADIGESTNLSPAQLAIKWQLWVRLRDYLKQVNAQMPTLDPTYPGTTNGTFVLAGATGVAGDADSDGLNDNWEFRELLTYQFNGTDDIDQDGVSNAAELAQGTDPLIPNAYRIDTITEVSPTHLQLTWNSTPGASFAVESSTNLVNWIPATTVTAGNVFSGNVTVEKTKPHEFFRVRRL